MFSLFRSPTDDIESFLKYVKSKYGNPNLFVTDTGKSDCGTLYDEDRIHYMKAYIASLKRCKLLLQPFKYQYISDENNNDYFGNSFTEIMHTLDSLHML